MREGLRALLFPSPPPRTRSDPLLFLIRPSDDTLRLHAGPTSPGSPRRAAALGLSSHKQTRYITRSVHYFKTPYVTTTVLSAL